MTGPALAHPQRQARPHDRGRRRAGRAAARTLARLLPLLVLIPLLTACLVPEGSRRATPIVRRVGSTPGAGASPVQAGRLDPELAPPPFCASARADQIGVAGNAFPWEARWREFGQLLECSGASWARVELRWEYIQPRRGTWDFGNYDRLINGYAAHEFQQLGLLVYSVAWASGGVGNAPVFGPPSDLDAWEAFVRATVARYRDRIHAWEIWNEPDVAMFWNGRDGGDPQGYLALLERAHRAIKSVDPSAVVMNGGVTGTERGARFLATLLDLGGGAYLDAVAMHPYLPNDGVANDDYRVLVWPLLRAVVERAGKPVWLTEVGWSVGPGENASAGSEAAQARNLARHLPLLFTLGGVTRAFVFTFKDPNNQPDFFGLTRSDATIRPAYVAIGVIAERLSGLHFAGQLPSDVPGVTILRFTSPDRSVDIVWADGGEPTIAFAAEQPSARVWRIDGRHEVHPATDGELTLTLGPEPILVEQTRQASADNRPARS